MADEDEFCALVTLGRETRGLDYKNAAAWDPSDKASCCAIVKDILALANSGGGSIVVGVDETATAFVRSGLSADQLKTWETTRVNNFVQNYADPPVNLEIAKPICEGQQYAVILVRGFERIPHICVKDFPAVLSKPTLYVRTANNASEPLGSAQDLQNLVERAVRTRQDQMLEAMRGILTGSALIGTPTDAERFDDQIAGVRATFEDPYPDQAYDGYFAATMFPAQFEALRFSLADLRRAAQVASVTFRGWPFIYFSEGDRGLAVMNDGLRYELRDARGFGGADIFFRWDFKQSGLLMTRSLLWEEGPDVVQRLGRVVDPNTIIYFVAEAIAALVNLYTELGLSDETIELQIGLAGARDRRLAVVDPGRFSLDDRYVARESEITVSHRYPLAEWTAGLRELATEMAYEILQRFQVTVGFSVREWVDKLLDRRLR